MRGTWLKVFCSGNDCSPIFGIAIIVLFLLWLYTSYRTFKNFKKNGLPEIFKKWEASLFSLIFPIIVLLILLSQ